MTANETKKSQTEPTVDQAFDAFDQKLAKALEALQQFQEMDINETQIPAEANTWFDSVEENEELKSLGAKLDSYSSREEFLAAN